MKRNSRFNNWRPCTGFNRKVFYETGKNIVS